MYFEPYQDLIVVNVNIIFTAACRSNFHLDFPLHHTMKTKSTIFGGFSNIIFRRFFVIIFQEQSRTMHHFCYEF